MRKIEKQSTDDRDRPTKEVMIADSGEIPMDKPLTINTNDSVE